MECTKFNPIFLTILLTLCIELCGSFERGCLEELNSLKREVMGELNNINNGMLELFKSVEEIKSVMQTDIQTQSFNNKSASDDMNTTGNSVGIFKADKQLNRQLMTRVQAVEDYISRIVKDGNISKTFKEYINDTQKARQVGRTKDANDSIENGFVTGHDIVNKSLRNSSKNNKNVVRTSSSPKGVNRCFCENQRGVFGIYLKSLRVEKSIYCDANTDGGDWIVIMRRQDGSVDFDRDWNDYKNGFGNVEGEFWIGNDVLHELTKSRPMELRIDMEDYKGNKAFAKYKRFQVGSETDQYELTATGYIGTAGDSLHKVEHSGGIHNGMEFSTSDVDNDIYEGEHCARLYPGGWWFNKCFRSHLTGKYGENVKGSYKGIIWHTWLGWYEYIKYVDMKIR